MRGACVSVCHSLAYAWHARAGACVCAPGQVWPRHKSNLVLVERYHFFPSSRGEFNLAGPGLVEQRRDEVAEEDLGGLLLSMAALLERLWAGFYAKLVSPPPGLLHSLTYCTDNRYIPHTLPGHTTVDARAASVEHCGHDLMQSQALAYPPGAPRLASPLLPRRPPSTEPLPLRMRRSPSCAHFSLAGCMRMRGELG